MQLQSTALTLRQVASRLQIFVSQVVTLIDAGENDFVQALRQQALPTRKRSPVAMYPKQCVGAGGRCVLKDNGPSGAKPETM